MKIMIWGKNIHQQFLHFWIPYCILEEHMLINPQLHVTPKIQTL